MRTFIAFIAAIVFLAIGAVVVYRIPRNGLDTSVQKFKCQQDHCDVQLQVSSNRDVSSEVGISVIIYSAIHPRIGGRHIVGHVEFVEKLEPGEKRSFEVTVPNDGTVSESLLRAEVDAYTARAGASNQAFKPTLLKSQQRGLT